MWTVVKVPVFVLGLVIGGGSCKSVIEVGVLLELTEYWYSDYAGFYSETLDHAFKEIEERGDILPGFTFNMTVKDTKVAFFIL